MSRRSKKYVPKAFESTGAAGDTYASIFHSMLVSKAFHSLNPRQRHLYLICKDQYYGKRKPKADRQYAAEEYAAFRADECFYLNWGAMSQYGLYSNTSSSTFYKDMKELIEAGFIEKMASGKATHTKNVYKLSSKWRYA